MKKVNVFLLILALVLIPTVVFGDVEESENFLPLGVALFVEAFVSIHMSVFVLLPLSKIFAKKDANKLFWTLFVIRVIILLFFVTPNIAMIDFVGVFVGAFLIVPLSAFLNRKNLGNVVKFQTTKTYTKRTYYMNDDLNNNLNNNFGNVNIPSSSTSKNDTSPIVEIDRDYLNSENVLMGNIIRKEIENQDEDPKTLTTPELNSKKNLAILIFGVLTALFIIMYKYYKYPLYISIIGEIVSTIFFIYFMSKYNVVNAIYEYAKKNPDSEIFQIVTSVKDRKKFGVIPDYIKIVTVLSIAIVMPILLI